jgi:hypothetical protein
VLKSLEANELAGFRLVWLSQSLQTPSPEKQFFVILISSFPREKT